MPVSTIITITPRSHLGLVRLLKFLADERTEEQFRSSSLIIKNHPEMEQWPTPDIIKATASSLLTVLDGDIR